MDTAGEHDDITYDQALEVFLATDPAFGGGLTNHGPMAAEALVSMGVDHWLGRFVASYRTRLEPPTRRVDPAPDDWEAWFRARLPELVGSAGNLAGHGLLRVAHAVRGIERAGAGGPSPVQRAELGVAVDYWAKGGAAPAGPPALTGRETPAAWASAFPRLDPAARAEGLLTTTLRRAAETDGFSARVATLAGDDPATTFDALAVAAAGAFRRNSGIAAFALLHGVTVSSMARVLLSYGDDDVCRRLEAAVATFVAAALVGYDGGTDDDAPSDASLVEDDDDRAALAERAAASLDDHTIKFADACLGVASRTGDDQPILALRQRLSAA
jgi:hypothetical protein